MADALASFLGSDPEELARRAVACGRVEELERFSNEVLHHVHQLQSSGAAAAASSCGMSTPAAGAAAAVSAVPTVTPSYEGIGLLDEMAAFSDEEDGNIGEEESRKPAAAASSEQNNDDNYGDGDEDSVATVPRAMPLDDDGEEGDTEAAAPAPVTSVATEAANSTAAAEDKPGTKFKVDERVVVLARNPALAARGRYEAKILQVGPKTGQSGRCRKSKFEYSVRYDGYGSDWDEWLPESSVEERNGETLKQVATRDYSIPERKARAKRAPRPNNGESEGALRAVAQRRQKKRRRDVDNTVVNNQEEARGRRRYKKRTKRKGRDVSDSVPGPRVDSEATPSDIPRMNNELVRSEGRTRDELNALDRSSDFYRMKAKTGIFAKFGMASVATKFGDVSHIVMNDEWNKLVTCRDEMQDLEFGLGEGRARAAELLASVGSTGIPFFQAPKVAEQNTKKIFYVGHWAPLQAESVKYRRPKTFMGKPRQMRLRLKFVRYDKNIDKVMKDGHL